jgi:2-oxoisovalerate dehydrogenase E1 component beta subunit
VTGLDTPFPYALEQDYLPTVPRVLQGVEAAVTY